MRLAADRRDNVVAVSGFQLDAAGVRPDRISEPRRAGHAPRLRHQAMGAAAGAHVLALLIAQFGVPFLFYDPPVAADVIPVEVVTIDEITTPPPPPAEVAETPEPLPPPPPPETPPAPPPPEVASAPPEPPAPPPIPEEVVAPEPEPKPQPAPPPPEAKPKPPEPQLPQALARATPQRKPKPPAQRDFTQVLKDLDLEDEPTRTAETPPPAEPAPTPPQPQQVVEATATEIDALRALIRRQIEPCWNPPVGAQYAEELVVSLRVWVAPTGEVQRVQVVNGGLMALDSFYEAAADSARRALLNPKCNPLELPRDRYKLWQQMELTFNPQEMMGL